MKEGMKLSSPPKLMEKLVWVPVISFFAEFDSQLSILTPYYAKTGHFRPLIT
jgi:hypothetical protein